MAAFQPQLLKLSFDVALKKKSSNYNLGGFRQGTVTRACPVWINRVTESLLHANQFLCDLISSSTTELPLSFCKKAKQLVQGGTAEMVELGFKPRSPNYTS